MPEQEFELYLSLLAKLLRLSPSQKAAITDELRDHLEERLDTLIQSGLSREQAIQKAMDEFGDMTGFALDLTNASKTPIRKVIVRSTLAASAAAACIVAAVVLFTPQHRVAAPNMVQADSPEQVAVEEQAAAPAPTGNKPLAALLKDQELFPDFLKLSMNITLNDFPILKLLQQPAKSFLKVVPVFIDEAALAEEGISMTAHATLNLDEVSVEETLNLITKQLDLIWQIDSGIVQITTPSHARYLTRQFDLHELAQSGHQLGSLINILQMDTGTWEDIDGEGGTLAIVGETLIVRHTFQSQRRIARILALVEDPPKSHTSVDTHANSSRLIGKLNEPCEIDVTETPLSKVIYALRDKHKFSVQIDNRGLNEDGISLDQSISFQIRGTTLATALKFLLDRAQLTYQIRNDVLHIITKSRAESDMTLSVYNFSDLGSSPRILPQLINAISKTTTAKWEDVDGEGGKIVPTTAGHLLFVKQTEKAHAEIEQLIEHLKQTWKNRDLDKLSFSAPSTTVIKTYRMPSDVASDMLSVIPKLVAPASWNVPGKNYATIHLVASHPIEEQVDGVVSGSAHEVRQVNPSTSIVLRPMSMIIVRQSPDVHLQIHKLLADMRINVDVGVLNQNTKESGMMGGAGGGINAGGMGGGMGGGWSGGGMGGYGGANAGGMGGAGAVGGGGGGGNTF